MKKLVIAPRQMHQDILNEYRKDNPFFDVKLITKESLLSDYYGKVLDGATKYILKKYSYSYENIVSFLSFIPFVDEQYPELLSIKNELIQEHLLVKNDFLNLFFIDKDVEIIGYSKNDMELMKVLDSFKVSYQFKCNNYELKNKDIFQYETVLDETFYVLNRIAKLIDQGVSVNDIYICTGSNAYDYYLEKYASSFGFNVDLFQTYSLYTYSISNAFINRYIENRDFNASLSSLEEYSNGELLNAFTEVLTECYDPDLPFDKQLDLLIGELKRTRYGKKRFKDVVRVINRPIYRENAHIFVLGFVQGSFPKSYKDNRFLSDSVLAKCGLNTSIVRSQIEEDCLSDFFKSNNYFYFSYPERSIKDKFLESPFKAKLNLEKKSEKLPEIIYSKDMAEYFFVKLSDLKTFYKAEDEDYNALNEIVNIPYLKYDNQFSGVNIYQPESYISHSYSAIKKYYGCPFSYYLSKILEIDPYEETFASKYGSLCHEILEHQLDPGFDFDEMAQQLLPKYDFKAEELPLLKNILREVKIANETMMQHYSHMAPHKVLTEKELSYPLTKYSRLHGFIDKSIILEDKYLVIVDYKTGDESFVRKHLDYGESMQLPTYYLLASNDKVFSKYQVVGLFINNIVDHKINKNINNGINEVYKLDGKFLADFDIMGKLDDNFSKIHESLFVTGLKLNADGSFKKNIQQSSAEELQEISDIVKTKYIEADSKIRNNEFTINPLILGKNDNKYSCKYCEFKDICFVKHSQKNFADQNVIISDEEDDDDE